MFFPVDKSNRLPAPRPKLIFRLSSSIEGNGTVPDIRIYFYQEITSYDHGFALGMVNVVGYYGSADGYFRAHKFMYFAF
jgi:hypothetical protein